MGEVEFPEQVSGRETLHSGQTVDVRAVVVDGGMPFLEEGGSHELDEAAHGNDAQGGIVEQSWLRA